jgi:predicted Ser/Thr protein kinase
VLVEFNFFLVETQGSRKSFGHVGMVAAIDVPKLKSRIEIISKTFVPKGQEDDEPEDAMFYVFRSLLSGIILNSMVSDPTYWTKAGVRVEDAAVFEACGKRLLTNSKVLGEGYYGKVYNAPANASCFKKVPKGMKRVGVKVEKLKSEYDKNQTPERLVEVVKIAQMAAKLEIGPALYDAFVVIDAGGTKIVKVFEIIDGTSWQDIRWTNPKAKADAIAQLDKHIHTMNKAGIIHHDLHSGNVMVGKNGRIYIIDYDLARRASMNEAGEIGSFSGQKAWEPKGIASSEGVRYVYKKLVEEGSIDLGLTAKSDSRRKTRRSRR